MGEVVEDRRQEICRRLVEAMHKASTGRRTKASRVNRISNNRSSNTSITRHLLGPKWTRVVRTLPPRHTIHKGACPRVQWPPCHQRSRAGHRHRQIMARQGVCNALPRHLHQRCRVHHHRPIARDRLIVGQASLRLSSTTSNSSHRNKEGRLLDHNLRLLNLRRRRMESSERVRVRMLCHTNRRRARSMELRLVRTGRMYRWRFGRSSSGDEPGRCHRNTSFFLLMDDFLPSLPLSHMDHVFLHIYYSSYISTQPRISFNRRAYHLFLRLFECWIHHQHVAYPRPMLASLQDELTFGPLFPRR